MVKLCDSPLTRPALEDILRGMDGARVALIGDLCLDMYWEADMRMSELSRETPHHPLPIVAERFSPGGAGNAACNIAALKPGRLAVTGVVGTDWRGGLLLEALRDRGVDDSLVIRDPARVTNAYIKPLRRGISDVVYEDPRLDFESREALSPASEDKLLAALDEAARAADVICVCDQLRFGCVTPRVRERLCALGEAGRTVIVDSRDRAAEYRRVTVKPNELEAVRAFGGSAADLEGLAALAAAIQKKNQRLTLITLGEKGCLVADGGRVVRVPACPVEPPIDFCGAGDTFMAGFAMALAAGADPVSAAQTAALCAAVTIKKLGVTGTASREEVLAAWEEYHTAG
ncbi:MAG: sugar kinase [Clostridia bacterium]|nr:sugar kinase [Clostridia bacterium]